VRIAARVVLAGRIVDILPRGFIKSTLEGMDELFSEGPEEIRIKDPSTGRIVIGIKIE